MTEEIQVLSVREFMQRMGEWDREGDASPYITLSGASKEAIYARLGVPETPRGLGAATRLMTALERCSMPVTLFSFEEANGERTVRQQRVLHPAVRFTEEGRRGDAARRSRAASQGGRLRRGAEDGG